jgi:hypothetical protein
VINKLLNNADQEITEFCTFRGLVLENSSPRPFCLAITLTLITIKFSLIPSKLYEDKKIPAIKQNDQAVQFHVHNLLKKSRKSNKHIFCNKHLTLHAGIKEPDQQAIALYLFKNTYLVYVENTITHYSHCIFETGICMANNNNNNNMSHSACCEQHFYLVLPASR